MNQKLFPAAYQYPTLLPPRLQHQAAALPVFKSFWMGGYEGADHISNCGLPLSMCDVTQHQLQADADYRKLAEFGISTVRESVGWRTVDHGGRYDFTALQTRLQAAKSHGLQVIWTLCHYGWPDDLNVFSAAFVDRFAAYVRAVAHHLRGHSDEIPVYAPINEISFLAWAACQPGRIHPGHDNMAGRHREFELQLVRAAIAACESIWDVDPRARIIHTDPLMHIAAPAARPDLERIALLQRARQFRVWDMLSGKLRHSLGGQPRYLDMVGVNYYQSNQWELMSGAPLAWRLDDPRRVALADLLDLVQRRYGRPMIIAETSHAGVQRGAWIREVALEVQAARNRGAQVQGICIYPIIDRPDWDSQSRWYRSGLWELEAAADGTLERRLDESYAASLQLAQETVETTTAALRH